MFPPIAALIDSPDDHFARDVLTQLCATSAKAVRPERNLQVSIWLLDEDQELFIGAGHRVNPRTMRQLRLSPGKGFAGDVFASGRPRVISDISRATEEEYVPDPNAGKPPHSIMGSPVYSDSRGTNIAGVLCFSDFDSRSENQLDAGKLTLMQPYVVIATMVLTLVRERSIQIEPYS